MENEFYNDDFEQLLKDKADQFRMYPSKRVWHSIYNNLHPSRRWPSVVMSILLLTSLGLIGYLNTGDNGLGKPMNVAYANQIDESNANANTTSVTKPLNKLQTTTVLHTKATTQQQPVDVYANAFKDVMTNETDLYEYTIVKSNRPDYYYNSLVAAPVEKQTTENIITVPASKDIVQNMDQYIRTNQIFADIPATSKKKKPTTAKAKSISIDEPSRYSETDLTKSTTLPTADIFKNETSENTKPDAKKITEANKTSIAKLNPTADNGKLTEEEKAWIENYYLDSKSARSKWKGKLGYQFYVTPAVNYRKLSSETQGSVAPFATGDINKRISQKPGMGMEAGVGLTYSLSPKLLLKVGAQFNYNNYNIDADKAQHPIITTILLNDPATGYSYAAARTSTTANLYNGDALQPVTLHNRTFQLAVPVGLAYKLSSKNNVDWFAGASVQPTYIFGGNAHIISSDMKSYVSEPSSISSWNLNLGFETYMNFKMAKGVNLQVGPQVRYQVFSTYRSDVALKEKPYAVGLKLGLTKGF